MTILERVRLRVPDQTEAPDQLLTDYAAIITDRLNLRLGTAELPSAFESIAVDATVKMYRRTYYEGITSEDVANISTSFVSDILAEYDPEITGWLSANADSADVSSKVVHFL